MIDKLSAVLRQEQHKLRDAGNQLNDPDIMDTAMQFEEWADRAEELEELEDAAQERDKAIEDYVALEDKFITLKLRLDELNTLPDNAQVEAKAMQDAVND